MLPWLPHNSFGYLHLLDAKHVSRTECGGNILLPNCKRCVPAVQTSTVPSQQQYPIKQGTCGKCLSLTHYKSREVSDGGGSTRQLFHGRPKAERSCASAPRRQANFTSPIGSATFSVSWLRQSPFHRCMVSHPEGSFTACFS